LIIVESTVGPGTTGGLVRDLLEANGKRAGRDFLLGFSPERIDPGSTKGRPQDTPKVVAGLDDESLSIAAEFYEQAGYTVVLADSLEAAEASKLLENTYRAVNMSLINEVALGLGKIGIEITEVIRLASTKPFGFQAFYPAIGVGGHCIPVDPWYLLSAIEGQSSGHSVLRFALENNLRTPSQIAEQVDRLLRNRHQGPQKPKILILGMTYKADVADFRESPGPILVSNLIALGYQVGYHDPFITESIPQKWEGTLETDLRSALRNYHFKVLTQNHSMYLCDATILESENIYWGAGAPSTQIPSIWNEFAAQARDTQNG